MRTNIDIDDETLENAMRAGPFKTKKDAVDAGLKLLARQAAYREILKWEGKLRWEGDAWADEAQRVVPTTGAAARKALAVPERDRVMPGKVTASKSAHGRR